MLSQPLPPHLEALCALEREFARALAESGRRPQSPRAFRALLEGRQVDGVPLSRFYAADAFLGDAPQGESTLDERRMILSGCDVAVLKHPAFDAGNTHRHNFYEMIWVCRGQAINRLEGREFPLREGQFFLLRPGVAHSLLCGGESVALNILVRRGAFEGAFLDILALSGLLAGFFTRGDSPYLLLDSQGDPQVRQTALWLLEESLRAHRYKGAVLGQLLTLLFTLLVSRHEESIRSATPLPPHYRQAQRILQYLNEHYPHASLEDAARQLFFSKRHLCRILRESCGATFSSLLQRVRVEAARKLLLGTTLPVEAIAHEVGFGDATYFIRVFKRLEGVTPAAYRRGSAMGRT